PPRDEQTPEALGALLNADIERWWPIIKAANIRPGRHVIWPWQDRTHGFSWLKAGTFALMFLPTIWLIHQVATQEFGPVPSGGLTYWSGGWATAILLLALAITPVSTIFHWRQIIDVRRMFDETARAYSTAA